MIVPPRLISMLIIKLSLMIKTVQWYSYYNDHAMITLNKSIFLNYEGYDYIKVFYFYDNDYATININNIILDNILYFIIYYNSVYLFVIPMMLTIFYYHQE